MAVLGHSQVGLTLDTYIHMLPELRREITDRMDDLLERLQPLSGDDTVADEVDDAGDEESEASSDGDDSTGCGGYLPRPPLDEAGSHHSRERPPFVILMKRSISWPSSRS